MAQSLSNPDSNYSHYSFQPFVFSDSNNVIQTVQGWQLPRSFRPNELVDWFQNNYNVNRDDAKMLRRGIMKHIYKN